MAYLLVCAARKCPFLAFGASKVLSRECNSCVLTCKHQVGDMQILWHGGIIQLDNIQTSLMRISTTISRSLRALVYPGISHDTFGQRPVILMHIS